MTARLHAAFGVVASLIVGFAVVWGFVLAGSPSTRRDQLIDDRRLQDLQAIARAIQTQVTDEGPYVPDGTKRKLKHSLPKTLDDVARNDRSERLRLLDPESGEPYAYKVVNSKQYTLCATFNRPRDADLRVFWNHPAGEHCFTIDVLESVY